MDLVSRENSPVFLKGVLCGGELKKEQKYPCKLQFLLNKQLRQKNVHSTEYPKISCM